jgi:LCP family protein required for cell wall assembly
VIPHSRRGMLWRFLAGAIVVIGATAATTAVAGLLQFKQLAADISVGVVIPQAPITIANPGQPQTLLIIGSDHRAGEPFSAALTDTMLLVRLNPNSSTINVMSIPRDLQVNIPGHGIAKLNAAYSEGGTRLLTKTIQQQVFPRFDPNHILDINFGGFQALVNAIGCVYSDVDHRYYNDTRVTDYSSINVQPGYQRLCGVAALAFVRFRHTDSDLVRSARQQDFIRWAKDQYGLSKLVANRDRLLRLFAKHVETDSNLHSSDGLQNLFQLVAFSDGHTIRQVQFPAYQQSACGGTVNGQALPCYLQATSSGEAAAWARFMTPTKPQAAAAATHPAVTVKNKRKAAPATATKGLIADTSDGHGQAAQLLKLGMPIYFPRLIMSNSTYCLGLTGNCPVQIASPDSYPREYMIRDPQGHLHRAYRMTLAINPVLGEYYGVQGTTWLDPPLLSAPTETKTVAGKKLLLYADGGRLTTVAWRTSTGVFWISNTLNSNIPNQQMVGMAASFTRATP